jgi:hypothetical protein
LEREERKGRGVWNGGRREEGEISNFRFEISNDAEEESFGRVRPRVNAVLVWDCGRWRAQPFAAQGKQAGAPTKAKSKSRSLTPKGGFGMTTLGRFMREVLRVVGGHMNLDYHGIRSQRDLRFVTRRVLSLIIFNPIMMPIQP